MYDNSLFFRACCIMFVISICFSTAGVGPVGRAGRLKPVKMTLVGSHLTCKWKQPSQYLNFTINGPLSLTFMGKSHFYKNLNNISKLNYSSEIIGCYYKNVHTSSKLMSSVRVFEHNVFTGKMCGFKFTI